MLEFFGPAVRSPGVWKHDRVKGNNRPKGFAPTRYHPSTFELLHSRLPDSQTFGLRRSSRGFALHDLVAQAFDGLYDRITIYTLVIVSHECPPNDDAIYENAFRVLKRLRNGVDTVSATHALDEYHFFVQIHGRVCLDVHDQCCCR